MCTNRPVCLIRKGIRRELIPPKKQITKCRDSPRHQYAGRWTLLWGKRPAPPGKTRMLGDFAVWFRTECWNLAQNLRLSFLKCCSISGAKLVMAAASSPKEWFGDHVVLSSHIAFHFRSMCVYISWATDVLTQREKMLWVDLRNIFVMEGMIGTLGNRCTKSGLLPRFREKKCQCRRAKL